MFTSLFFLEKDRQLAMNATIDCEVANFKGEIVVRNEKLGIFYIQYYKLLHLI